MFRIILYGFSMAVADSVPGVSGGTIAFVLGFYEKLLEAITNLTKKNRDSVKPAISFLSKLMVGWIIGMAMSVLFLSSQFERHAYFMSSVFIGLTVCSIAYIIKNEKRFLVGHIGYFSYTVLGVFIVISISYLKTRTGANSNLDLSDMNIMGYLYVYIIGMVAISAMILPGVSGSTILLIFGVYIPLIESMRHILNMDFTSIGGVISLGLGIITGFLTTVRIVRRAFKKNRSKMIYFILGLTSGSIYSIAQGPADLRGTGEMLGANTFSIVGFFLGVGILLLLESTRSFKKIKRS